MLAAVDRWACVGFIILACCQPARAEAPASKVALTQLKCESRTAPLNVDAAAPRLSWVLSTDEHPQRQTAYQVLCASTPAKLIPEQADLWDSGRVESDRSIQVEYAGQPLATNQEVYWTVRIWDREGRPTEWAEPQRWCMALLAAGDWQASWISDAEPGPQPSPMEGSLWIWHPEPSSPQGTTNVAPGTRRFRKTFRLPAAARVNGATLWATADNEAEYFLNGQRVGGSDEWRRLNEFDVAGHLKLEGDNELTVTARNLADAPNPAGVVAVLRVKVDGGEDVVVRTDESWESAHEEAPTWVAAKRIAEWNGGPWRGESGGLHPPLPIFRKTFVVADKPLRRAVLHATGLGHYKLRMNGQDVGDHFLDPAWSNYETTVYYNSFDVTSQLRAGENALGLLLGRSYYSTKGDRRLHGKLFDRPPAALAQLELFYEDGTTARVATDGSWRYTDGPYRHDSLLGGADYDARKLPAGWDQAGFDDSAWQGARVIDPGLGKLSPAVAPPLRTFDDLRPVAVNEPAPGRYVYDFGQNASATVRLVVRGPAGATVRLTYAEQRHGQSPHTNDGQGLVDQSGIRTPNYIEYTLRGEGEETWFCDLFYSGYQYIELTGAVPTGFANPDPDHTPVVAALTSVHVRSSAPTIGQFACDNELWQRIDRMIQWSVNSNLSHVLTDCPQREKMGWLEVPHLMWDSLANRFDLSSFGPKVCQDIRDAQRADGHIPTVAPAYGDFVDGFAYTPEWGAAGTLIPWYVYQWYGDERNLAANFDMMKRFVDYMRSTCTDGLVPQAGLGDWYDYIPGQWPGPSKLTAPELSAMAVFYDCTRVVADAAAVLGRSDDEQAYRRLAAEIRADFNARFYQGHGVYANKGSCQTANAMAVVTGLVEPSERAATVRAIVADLEARNYQQTSGDVGFHYLVRALSDNGQAHALYRVLNRTDLGSYGHLANSGWTSLPEAWDAHHESSMNHCMLGHIQEFFTRTVAGIQPTAPAFKTILIRPTPGPGVNAARASVETPYGTVSSAWTIEEGVMKLSVAVPANTTARVEMPDGTVTKVESGAYEFTSAFR